MIVLGLFDAFGEHAQFVCIAAMLFEGFVRHRDIVIIAAAFGGILACDAANIIDAGIAGIAFGAANCRGIFAFAVVKDEAIGACGNAISIFADGIILTCWVALFVRVDQRWVDACAFDTNHRADAFGRTEIGIDAVIVDADFALGACRTAYARIDAFAVDAEFAFGCIAFGIAVALGHALVIVTNLGFVVASRSANLSGNRAAIVVGTDCFAGTNGRANRFGVDADTTDAQLFIGAGRIAFCRDAHAIDTDLTFGRVTCGIAGIIFFDAGIMDAYFVFFAFGIAQTIGIFACSMVADFACRASELAVFFAEIRVVTNAVEAFLALGAFGAADTRFFTFLIDADGAVTTFF